jgi:aldose sugar dehydrogenase
MLTNYKPCTGIIISMTRQAISNVVFFPLVLLLFLAFVSTPYSIYASIYAQPAESPDKISKASPPPASQRGKEPTVNDPNLKVEMVYRGFGYPSNMAFLGPDDILVIEKNTGTVNRIMNGQRLSEPLLDLNVTANHQERGMLGIAVSKHEENGGRTYVFLYLTESKDGDDLQGNQNPLGNRLYRYELQDNKLVNGKLLLDLPASGGVHHNGGNVLIGPDQNVYVGIGDNTNHTTQSQNVPKGPPPDGTGGILRVTQDGKSVGKGILGDKFPLNLYYAYGIRNTFGMDFDPVTGKLWDTENGPGFGDEINLVEPGFNSGWKVVQGIWMDRTYFGGEIAPVPPAGLVNFDGKGKYSLPEFTFAFIVAPTALKFLASDKVGEQYKDNMLVADVLNGNIYHFKLNEDRTQLVLNGSLTDKVGNSMGELNQIVFASGFAGISDMEVGPDGYLYILTYHRSQGSIWRISPANNR